MRYGGVVTLLILAPNIPWIIWGAKLPEAPKTQIPEILGTAEHVMRLLVFVLPFFYRINLFSTPHKVMGLLALLVLGMYYGCWARYYVNGWQQMYLGKALWGIPVPMAIFPVVFLLLSSYVLHALPLGICAGIFGILHIYISSLTL
jgi:hypothetical protein